MSDQAEHHEDCAERVQGIQRFHQQHEGWADIAYTWVVCGHGVVYEGRPVSARTAAQGSNVGNGHYLAVCVLGDGVRVDQTSGGRAVVDALLAVRGVVLGLNRAAVRVWPHLRFTSTSCPGSGLREWCRQFP